MAKLLLRSHVDVPISPGGTNREKRPRYLAFIENGVLTVVKPGISVHSYNDDVARRILYECYQGRLLMIPKDRYTWWRPRLVERAMLIAWDLPTEIRNLSKSYTASKSGGFTFTLYVNENGLENGYMPKIGIDVFGNAYSFRWRKPWRRSEHKYHHGRFLNLSQLVAAMRNEELTYEQALEEWNCETLEELYHRIILEFDALGLPVSEDRVFSSAGLAKAALRKQQVRRPRFGSKTKLGQAMVAYHGPRVETWITRTETPVTYVDFRSLYPAVSSLLGNWRILTADRLRVRPYTREARELVNELDRDDLFRPEAWKGLGAFCRVLPDDDVLPIRQDSGSRLARLRGSCGVWWALPDVLASKLLTGKTPRILEAWTIDSVGGRDDDYFVELINRRAREPELSKLLKVLANSGSYGIYAELNPTTKRPVTMYGNDGPFQAECSEQPGEFYFPPLAALTTAGGRLTMALLQTHVPSFVFCDTDSMAIVNGEDGLTWKQVEDIRAKFQALSPFDDGDFLKLEDENFVDGERTQLYAYATAPKEYCLFNEGDIIRKRTELGLVYANLTPERIDELWTWKVRQERDPFEPVPEWTTEEARDSIRIRRAASWKQYGTTPFEIHSLALGHNMARVINRGLGYVRPRNNDLLDVESYSYVGKEAHMIDLRHVDMDRVEHYQDRKCLCGCGTDLGDDDPRRLYVNETHRKRVQRQRGRLAA